MKRLIAFILILLSSIFSDSFACGPYYPYGEDIRFGLLKPEAFDYPDFLNFSYSASQFYSPILSTGALPSGYPVDDNTLLWRKRCNDIPDINDTYEAVYNSGNEVSNPNSNNTFIKYLHQKRDKVAIAYLVFAKRCNPYNKIIDDPWERNEHAKVPQRSLLIKEALERASTVKDIDIRSRYAFLAIRLAYYNDDSETIINTYDNYFAGHEANTVIDYWSMYFRTMVEPDDVMRNFYAARVFFNAPDKRDRLFYMYKKSVPVDEVLLHAKNRDQEAAVWMLSGFRTTGKCIDIIKKLYSLKPDARGLSALILREVNKLEDWIYTPYYTTFSPSIDSWNDDGTIYSDTRIAEDRAYAQELLDFISSADMKKVENPLLWSIVKAYLSYMTNDYEGSIAEIKRLEKVGIKDTEVKNEVDVIKSLCLVAKQTIPVIPEEVKPVLMREFALANNKFVFAIARELEFKGNTTDAAILLSKLNARTDEGYYGNYYRNSAYWRTKDRHYTLMVDYYDDYFFYLDAQYSTEQLAGLINRLKTDKNKTVFDNWKYSVIRKDLPRLYDLLGTKYMRNNDLKSALTEFKNVNDTLWTSRFYCYSEYLDANPFYTNMFNEHRRTDADTIMFSKPELTERLIEYLGKAEDKNNTERDYYYFLVANCYFNMTEYGNSWMMKRYYWTTQINKTGLEDDDDYFGCRLAREYYLKAGEVSRSGKFSALCLRMAGRCESYANSYDKGTYASSNSSFDRLKKEFPMYYDDMTGNCESFESYFNSRL